MTGEVQCPEQVRNIEWRLNRLKVHPHREKAKTKVKMIFDVQNFFFDLFRWFFDFLAFAFAFALCDWPLLSFSLRGTRHITDSSPTKSSTCASTGIEMDQPPCWLPRGQQVSHQRWIWGIYCTQVMKHASERIYPGKSRRHQKSKQGYQWPHKKRLMSSKQCCCFFLISFSSAFISTHLVANGKWLIPVGEWLSKVPARIGGELNFNGKLPK